MNALKGNRAANALKGQNNPALATLAKPFVPFAVKKKPHYLFMLPFQGENGLGGFL